MRLRYFEDVNGIGSFREFEGTVGLYVHVPFCISKCRYCDFASWAGQEDRMEPWIGAMEQELLRRREELDGRPLDTVFIGGGTPSVLPTAILERLIRAIASLPRRPGAEWSCEANPGSLNQDKLGILRDGGVNRISIGVQSLNDRLLQRLGRSHDARTAHAACELLEHSGLRWNADLMFAVPEQSIDDFRESLRGLIALGARHISFYGLSIEPGTAFGRELSNGTLREADEDLYADMYLEGVRLLQEAGIERYEVSNFAAPGEECRHNLGYWKPDGSWLAAGNAAHGFLPWRRWSSPRSLEAWLRWAGEGFPEGGREEECLSLEERYTERWFLGLRTREGVNLTALREEFGKRSDQAPLQTWLQSGDLTRQGDTVRLQGNGWLRLDAIAADCSR